MRIRTIKPEFFSHPEIVILTIPSRLLLLSMLGQADDEGRMYDQPLKIAGLAFGENDDVNVRELLAELADKGRILRYNAAGRDCIEIIHFSIHQRINRRTPSVIPPPPRTKSSRRTHGALTEVVHREQGTGNREQGKEQGTGNARARRASAPDEKFDEFYRIYPRHEAPTAARKAWGKLPAGTDLDDVIAGAQRFRDDPQRDPGFTPHPATWLNAGRWNDDALPARAGPFRKRDNAAEIVASVNGGGNGQAASGDPGRRPAGALPGS